MADYVDTPSLTFIVRSAVDSLATLLSPTGLTLIVRSEVNSLATLLSSLSFTVRFRPDVTNGLLFSEVLAAMWNESAIVFLNPELLAPVWNEEAVITDAMFGYPGTSQRIQTVDSDIEIQ